MPGPEISRAVIETVKGATLFGGTGTAFYYFLFRMTRWMVSRDDPRMNAIESLHAERVVDKERGRLSREEVPHQEGSLSPRKIIPPRAA